MVRPVNKVRKREPTPKLEDSSEELSDQDDEEYIEDDEEESQVATRTSGRHIYFEEDISEDEHSDEEGQSNLKTEEADQEPQPEKKSWSTCPIISLLSLVVVFISCLVFQQLSQHTCGIHSEARLSEFSKRYTRLIEPKYNSWLSPDAHRNVKVGAAQILGKAASDYDRPQSFLILASPRHKSTADCFAKDLTALISEVFCEQKPDWIFLDRLKSSMELDSLVAENLNLDNRHLHVQLMFSLESMRSDYLNALHKYIDHSTALYQYAIYVISASHSIVEAHKPTNQTSRKIMDQISHEFFDTNWKSEIAGDMTDPIASRFTQFIVIADTENQPITCNM